MTDQRTDQGRVYQLKMTLADIRPPIWRRVLIAADTKLPRLHRLFQVVMGWENYHLHAFVVGEVTYGEPDPDFDEPGILSERRVRLMTIAGEEKTSFIYAYDLGDGWRHEVEVETILPAEPRALYPLCTAGKRACPPEDCGGPWGYASFLEALADPAHEEHEPFRQWIGGVFDAEGFDLNAVNRALRKVR